MAQNGWSDAVLCEHLRDLEEEITASGIAETFRGQAWSDNCREWVYFDRVLDLAALRARFSFAPFVVDHQHRGTHDGQESGFVCEQCKDAVMGRHPADPGNAPIYR